METIEIDDLLKQVSPELIAGYEKKNLAEGVTLAGVNQEYRAAVKKRRDLGLLWNRLTLYTLFAVLVCMVALSVYQNKLMIDIGIPGMLIGILLLMLYVMGPMHKREKESQAVQDWCKPILENFKQSVETLKPLGAIDRESTNSSVRETLVRFAANLFDAEKKCEQVCALRAAGKLPVSEVLYHGFFEEKCREQFERTLRSAEKFGLVFIKSDICKDATKRLERIAS